MVTTGNLTYTGISCIAIATHLFISIPIAKYKKDIFTQRCCKEKDQEYHPPVSPKKNLGGKRLIYKKGHIVNLI